MHNKHDAQYSYETRYKGQHEENMQHPGASLKRPAQSAREHHHDEPRGYHAIDHTKHMERVDVAAPSHNPLTLEGIMGGAHGEHFNFPVGTNPRKRVEKEPRKMGASGIHKGGI